MTRLFAYLLASALALAALPAPSGAQGVPPDARWMTIETEHFRVHYTPGLEVLGRRAAARAEEARAELEAAFVRPPRGKVDLVVSDNVDFANGYATPFPTNRVVVYAHAPVDDPELGFFDDWLELVITHELVHTFQLDHVSGPLRALRAVLGRHPLTFPNAATPPWFVEGVATYLESRLTSAGRVRGTLHEMEIRTAILEDEFFSIDQATGHPTSWPGGSTRYVYGSLFLDWLAGRRGHENAGEFVREIGDNLVPYFVDDAARDAYGTSFSAAWREWRSELQARYATLADSLRAAAGGVTEPEVLTRAGRRTEFPRFSPDSRTIAFSQATGRSEPATKLLEPDGEVEVLDGRTTLGPLSWRADGEGLVTAMIDARDPYRYYADLYTIGLDGDKDRLTTGARLMHPDASRADGRIAAVRADSGRTSLVVVDAEGGGMRTLAEATTDVHWAFPRWSPDGRRIAAVRWEAGGYHDVVIVDAATGAVTRVTRDRAIDNHPAWSPDGRYVVFSSDRTGIANLYAYDTRGGALRQVTNVLTGAFHPDVSPDGRWIALTLYRADGYHLARIPFDPAAWRDASPVRPEAAAPGADPAALARASDAPARRYSPWRSLLPATWSPILTSEEVLGTAIGASTGGTDVMGRHTWGAYGAVFTEGGRFEGSLSWLYRGLGDPTLGASVYQDWDVLRRGVPGQSALLERERAAALVATFTRPRFRSYGWLSLGADVRSRDRLFDEPELGGVEFIEPTPEIGAVLTLGWSTARAYEYSISTETGFLAAASLQGRRFTEALPGEDEATGYTRLTGRLQGYQPLGFTGSFARHVVGARAAAGLDFGRRAPGFSLGGNMPLAVAYPLSVGTGIGGTPDFPVRGYDEGATFGDRAVAASLEWRFPLALVERGWRVLPLYLDRLWGTAFADGGAAWCVEFCLGVAPESRPDLDPIYSVGAELGADVSFGYAPPFGVRLGMAIPLRSIDYGGDFGRLRPDPELYFAIGRSF